MRASLIFAAVLLVAVAFASAKSIEDPEQLHNLVRRETIFVKPPPGCIFYECIRRCKQRGYKSGGYCTINGCVCL
ncbi:hypothetical protein O3G_MSEX013517 [Manduca sexta]|uniref:Uncharacterized protein n=1 Tax=Manduca sexta TaxID=7130 RepID=A0A921ZU04_MANSE|nr:hypothetical protein O3G_MSEX013517 [Manduca sexta]